MVKTSEEMKEGKKLVWEVVSRNPLQDFFTVLDFRGDLPEYNGMDIGFYLSLLRREKLLVPATGIGLDESYGLKPYKVNTALRDTLVGRNASGNTLSYDEARGKVKDLPDFTS